VHDASTPSLTGAFNFRDLGGLPLAQLAQFSVAFTHFARVGMRGIIDLHSSTAPKRV
jgi:hypothetical protein